MTKHEPAEPMVFIGFDMVQSANYWLLNPKTGKITTCKVTFVETEVEPDWYKRIKEGLPIKFIRDNTPKDAEYEQLVIDFEKLKPHINNSLW